MKKGMLPLIVGNWKMNPPSVTIATSLAKNIKTAVGKIDGVDIVIAPPTVYIASVHAILKHSKTIALGVQTIHHEKLGAFTGEISIPMVHEFLVKYIILGHSERRAIGEDDITINEKLTATLKAGMTAILCIGEKTRDVGGLYLSGIEKQIRAGLVGVSRTKLSQVVIAYEPVWAIGSGVTPTADDIHEMRLFIEKIISDMYERNYAQKVRVLYGGSVDEKNARELFVGGTVDGFLVGGASLHAKTFRDIIISVLPSH